MTFYTWRELALADAVLTNVLFDNEEVHSHKVLFPGDRCTLNTTLHALLEKEYKETLLHFEIKPVNYLPDQKFTNLGVFAKSEIEANCELSLRGFMAEIEELEELPDDANVSVFHRNGAELMLGPLSFVNHSCWPNTLYVKSQSNKVSLRTLRSIQSGEEVTVKYGPKYFGEYNVDCLCPHVEFHGEGTLVLSSRTRSEAKISGEKGLKRKILCKQSVTKKRSTNNNQTNENVSSISRSHLESPERDDYLMRIPGRYCTIQGKKVKETRSRRSSSFANSSSESDTSFCSDSDQSIFEQVCSFERGDNSPKEPEVSSSAEIQRCSTPLHLSSFLEFTLPQEASAGYLSDNSLSSSDEDNFLYEKTDVTLESFEKSILDFVVRHKLADNAIRELLKLFKQFLPKPNSVPNDLHHRRSRKIADGFEVLNFRDQLTRVLERNEDVLSNESSLTLFMNTDGATPFHSSKKVFWPFWVMIDNLPTVRRTSLQNMMLLALWKGNTKPNFSVIGPIIKQELQDVSTGIFCTKLGKHFDVELKDFICDMIAKAPLLNVVQFNGYYGCIYCYTRGTHENHRHLYPCDEAIVPRSKGEFRRDADSAETMKDSVKGVKGRCFLDELISLPDDVPIDAMHQVHLGCAKSIITALISSVQKRTAATIDERLKKIKTPRSTCGRTKLLSEIAFWKARDFKFFLFHFGTFCLADFIDDQYLQSFNQLSVAIRLLSMKEVTGDNIKEAERLIGDFQGSFVKLYGKESQSFNIHSLRHLCDQVRRKGPLWRNSAFAFESANHFLLSSVQGTMKSLSHLSDNFLLRQKIERKDCLQKFDDRFTDVSADCWRFTFLECGPGHLHSRHYLTETFQTIASLSYTRLFENWSECIAQTKTGRFVVVAVYHQEDKKNETTAIVKFYRSLSPVHVFFSEIFYYEISQLDEQYSLLPVQDLMATRVIVLSGSLEKLLISVMKEGFEHN